MVRRTRTNCALLISGRTQSDELFCPNQLWQKYGDGPAKERPSGRALRLRLLAGTYATETSDGWEIRSSLTCLFGRPEETFQTSVEQNELRQNRAKWNALYWFPTQAYEPTEQQLLHMMGNYFSSKLGREFMGWMWAVKGSFIFGLGVFLGGEAIYKRMAFRATLKNLPCDLLKVELSSGLFVLRWASVFLPDVRFEGRFLRREKRNSNTNF